MSIRLPALPLKTRAKVQLTQISPQKRRRHHYFATASTVQIITFGLFWLLFQLGRQEKTLSIADSMYAVAAWIGSFWAWRTAYRACCR